MPKRVIITSLSDRLTVKLTLLHFLLLWRECCFVCFESLFVLEGDNVIATVRKMNGATNPAEAMPGTVRGDFEGEREGRYYTDYTEKSVETLFTAVPSLQKVDMWLTDDARPERNDRWINCIWVKK